MPRTAGKYGRRPPKQAPALRLGRLLTGVLPTYPSAADYLAAMNGGWQMLGNDRAGCCVAVTWANVRRLVTTFLAAGYYPSQDQVWEIYQTQNPGFDPDGTAETNGPGSPADRGMDIQTLLEYLVQVGGPDGVKAVGFASVDVSNPAEVKAAIAIFGYVWTGINVLQCNMQEFSEGLPFDYVPGSPVDGGHSVITAGYGAPGSGPLGGDERFETWAEETSFTDAFWQNDVEEAWVVIWPEHLGSKAFLEGVDQAQLAADFQELTGRPFPGDSAPAPAPSAESLLANLAAEIRAAVTEFRPVATLLHWLEQHGI